MKTITLTAADLNGGDVKISCTLTASGATYGSITVDDNMDASPHPRRPGCERRLCDRRRLPESHDQPRQRLRIGGWRSKRRGREAERHASRQQSKLFASQPEDMVEFSYDHNGLRTQKKVTKADGEIKTSEYIFRNKLLTHLACEGKMVHFFYDKFKKPLFIELNGELFTYVYNLQGDVISIIDSVGTTVVSYKYDAWGGLLMTTKLSKQYDDLIELNPFRYRSYMFDDESKLYYLKTRFYDFEKGRMISADTVLGQRKVSNPHNVFAYCKSNPCMRVDYDGKFDFITYGDCGIPYDFYMRVFTKVRRAKEILDELETAFTKTTNKSFKQLLYETMPVASIKDIEFTKTEVYNNEMYGVLKTLSNLNTIGVPSVVSDALQSNPITFGAGPMAEIVMTLVGGFSEQIIVNNQYLAPELQMDTGTHNIYELHLTLQAPQAHTTIAMWYTFHEGEFFDGVDLTVMEMYDDGLQQDTIINNYTYTCN